MTGSEAWSLVAPMIMVPKYSPDNPAVDAMTEAYVLVNIGLSLFDSWVDHGKPDEWRTDYRGKKK